MQPKALNSTVADLDLTVNDLGPLAWVLDELRKSLEGASKALKRFVREAEAARGSDLAALDAGHLRIARQQLHQAVGALEMVGLSGPALVLRVMESAVQRFVQHPEQCSPLAASKIERASFALTEYLEGVLADRPQSPVSLFPQYREVQDLIRADRIHPADLWPHEWRWIDPQLSQLPAGKTYDADVRAVLDHCVLQIMKGGGQAEAQTLCDLSLALSVSQTDGHTRIFWKVAAAYFEAVSHRLLPLDLYVRRAASRVLMQFASLSKGETSVSERLAQDLLFFCAQAVAARSADTPVLSSVRSAFGLARYKPVDYEAVQFGRFDPALLAQARKRIVSAKETWSLVSAGETGKFKLVSDQFSLVTDSLVKLHPPSEQLAQALTRVVDSAARSGQAPAIELAMEVATSVLYLEAAFEDLDPNDPQLAQRTRRLAERLDSAHNGGLPEPLEAWMEELYRRVSDKQTMGSVVGELRISLGELEKSLDGYFRNPADKAVLRDVPGQLSQMRGVLSLLGLEQASQAVLRMRDSVDLMMQADDSVPVEQSQQSFEQLGNNLGALSFLIDMLNYQPALAKKLFVYDAVKGELRPLMGRTQRLDDARSVSTSAEILSREVISLVQEAGAGASDENITGKLDALATQAALAGQPELAKSAHDASVAVAKSGTEDAAVALNQLAASVEAAAPVTDTLGATVDFEEDDLKDIFLEEAREVTANGQEAVLALASGPDDISQLTILRRVFHTLKGSSRMVGLTAFGDAAWAVEQLFNSWLADQKPATTEFRTLSAQSLTGFSDWIEAIDSESDAAWSAAPFVESADAMRMESRFLSVQFPAQSSLDLPQDVGMNAALGVTVSSGFVPFEVAADMPFATPSETAPESAPVTATDSGVELDGSAIDFDLLFAVETTKAMDSPAPADKEQGDIQAIDFEGLSALFSTAATDGSPADTTSAAQPQAIELFAVSDRAALLPDVPTPVDELEAVEFSASAFSDQFLVESSAGQTLPFAATYQEPTTDVPSVSTDSTVAYLSAESLDAAVGDSTLAFLVVNDSVPPTDDRAIEVPEQPGVLEGVNSDVVTEETIEPDEQVKVIGALRIGIPLYNVYLNEADEWSRRLVTEVSEWAIECQHAVSDSMVALAHSLAGSSATVGFEALSDIARALEHVLQQSQAHHNKSDASQYAGVFVDAAEEIRRLLHQFAAGFLKQPEPSLLERLRSITFSESAPATLSSDSEFTHFADFQEAEAAASAALYAAPPSGLVEDTVTGLDAALVAAASTVPLMQNNASVFSAAVFAPVTASAPPAQSAQQFPPMAAPFLAGLSATGGMTANAFKPAAAQSFVGGDDEIDAIDAIDPELFPIFDEEASELMPQLGGALRQWSARPDNQSARMEVLRGLHTLKGSARLAGALRLGEMAHRIESEIEYLGSASASEQDFEPLLTRFDAMEVTMDALRRGETADVADAAAYFQAPVAMAAVAPEPAVLPLTPVDAQPADSLSQALLGAGPAEANQVPSAGAVMIPAPQTMALQPLRQAASVSIRVRSQLLDRMVNQAGEVMITRSRLEVELGQLRGSLSDMSGNLNRLRQQLRDIELQAETQMQSRIAQAKELQAGFDPLEFDRFTRVQELTRMMAESVNDVATVQRTLQRTVEATEDDLIAQARQTRELQRDLLRTRMVEFEGISDRLYRVVRQTSKETGKQVKLDLLGSTIEMDRGMLDRMTPSFEHLLRNCVVHGIESPEVRAQAGKDAAGLITVHLRQEGNDVSVEFSDDGAGLDLDRIRDKAISLGLMTAEQPMSDKDAAALIFMPGFSTAAQVSELAGRGIGMDVVRSEVNSVGGRIETNTVTGKGSSFKLVLPLTTAVTQVVMIRSGSLSVGVPANVVETVRRLSAKELQLAYNSGTLDVAGEAVPFFWSGALLQASRQTSEAQGRTMAIVVFRSAAQRVAVHVDEVLGNQEVVVKNLGPQLSRLPGLAGMSILASGAVVLIYNPVALASIYGQQARALSADSAEPHMLESLSESGRSVAHSLAPAVPQIPLVLVVDDSITVRRVTQRLLQREGYRVALAADGLQALERLQEERPSIVLSDIEMPRMDGFDLARNIRADARLKDLPIVMITSRIAEKHREHAKELGVDHYLGKPYPEDELMSLVRRYCNTELVT